MTFFRDKSTVLIIGASPALLSFVRKVIGSKCDLIEAEEGVRDLTLVRQIDPDLILSDTSVPASGGLEICKKLKLDITTRHIPIILFGRDYSVNVYVQALIVGAEDYLPQSVDDNILRLKVNNLIGLRKALEGRLDYPVSLDVGISNRSDGMTKKVEQLILRNISDPYFGVEDIATEVGISVSALYRRFRRTDGTTVNEFVKSIRMKRALQLLKAGILRVNEVASAVGYEDCKYFSKEFRKRFGMTPTEARRRQNE